MTDKKEKEVIDGWRYVKLVPADAHESDHKSTYPARNWEFVMGQVVRIACADRWFVNVLMHDPQRIYERLILKGKMLVIDDFRHRNWETSLNWDDVIRAVAHCPGAGEVLGYGK